MKVMNFFPLEGGEGWVSPPGMQPEWSVTYDGLLGDSRWLVWVRGSFLVLNAENCLGCFWKGDVFSFRFFDVSLLAQKEISEDFHRISKTAKTSKSSQGQI